MKPNVRYCWLYGRQELRSRFNGRTDGSCIPRIRLRRAGRLEDGAISLRKAKGRIENLQALLDQSPIKGTCGIATHAGRPTANLRTSTRIPIRKQNHPCALHNGIIENYLKLKKCCKAAGCVFVSETTRRSCSTFVAISSWQSAPPRSSRREPAEGRCAGHPVCGRTGARSIAPARTCPMGGRSRRKTRASSLPIFPRPSHTRDVCFCQDKQIAVLKKSASSLRRVRQFHRKNANTCDWTRSRQKGNYDTS
jgi:hypothetical protein